MKRLRCLTVILVLVLILSSTAVVQGLEISTDIKLDLERDTDENKTDDREKINLTLEEQFNFTTDGYLDLEIESDYEDDTDIGIHEAYINYYTRDIDWRLGKQEVSWGSAYKIKPTDYFSPNDVSDMHPLDEKFGVTGVKGIYYAPNGLEVTGIAIPDFEADEVEDGREAEVFKAATEERPTISDYTVQDADDLQLGVKVTKRRVNNFDLSFSAYHGRDNLPILDKKKTKNNLDPTAPKAFIKYPEVTKSGFDIIGDIDDMGIWLETAYSDYDDSQYDDIFETAVGIDYKFDSDLYLVGQWYNKEGRLSSEPKINAFNFYASKPVWNFHELEFTALYDTESDAYLLEPQFNYSIDDSIELQVGATYAHNEDDAGGMVSALAQDRLYTRLNIEF
ncbi:hypothetical protein [Acetohalobium arabaticum]|uniref:Porin domain-containing protein n=1 Tax=Acetohalobium arabaticum (strain ATCC 49924 / DSM 5501 / Z-7288) TaxID=574087 RepID=D9QRQ6_ACEAZ|nr:hypothetical protein [Acetohalobium arabaticum]ADL13197.1 hypothetical protein Acear_1692 [Acetohalobium arabaticum DSM 5501]